MLKTLVCDTLLSVGAGAELHRCHVFTYSCLRPSTCSMVVIPARAKLSLYWLILMDSSHSGTDRNTVPSLPLVLGRRIETLRSEGPAWLVEVYSTREGKKPETDSWCVFLPRIKVSDGFQRLRTTKQLVQKVDDVQEARSLGAVVLPTLKHELVDGRWTVHRSREPERLIDGLHDLMKRSEDLKGH